MSNRDASPLLGPDGRPLDTDPILPPARSELHWDQQPPTEPPTPVLADIPQDLEQHAPVWRGIAWREGVVYDLCLERAIKIVERNFLAGLVGIDHFSEQGSGPAGRLAIVQVAIPLAIEMHRHVIKAINDAATP